mmetsp:Transcript_29026/g.27990  ORF Transcript_29026/g.27990 Transcript_29026/m.27990 type:complete len:139 (-) Transcript_29026:1633-2049(-)
MYNFKWQPVSYGIKFERLSPMKPRPGEIGSSSGTIGGYTMNNGAKEGQEFKSQQMVNHFEFHHLISEKANLFNNLQKYSESLKENIFDICPITFYVEVTDVDKTQAYNQSLQNFVSFYQTLEDNKDRVKGIQQQIEEI